MQPTLKARGTKRLKLKDYEVLSRCAFNLNLHRYLKEEVRTSWDCDTIVSTYSNLEVRPLAYPHT
jgi:hypothetical protein